MNLYIAYEITRGFLRARGSEGAIWYDWVQCLSQDLDFSQKMSFFFFLGSYLQKRGVIHSQRKLRDKARKLRERV